MLSREIQNKTAAHSGWLRILATVVAAATTLGLWVSTMLKARGDFLLHYEFGRRLMHGVFLYDGDMHTPYPPPWAMLFAPFSLVPQRAAMALFFVVGFASLCVLVKVCCEFADAHFQESRGQHFWLVAAVLLVLSRFVLRDFADGGENLFIIALTWSGIFFFTRRKPLAGGALLGLAIALKCTPLLFIGYFFLKRQWIAMFSTFAFAAIFFLSPALVQGTKSYAAHVVFWKNKILEGVSQPDPSVGVLGPDELHNKALKPMLARFLMRLPDGHPGRFPGAAHIDFLRLDPRTAGAVIKIVTLLCGLGVALLFSRSPRGLDGLTLLWECAIISLLMLLFSPITWGQHCVAIIPAFFLILLRLKKNSAVPMWTKWCIAGVSAVFVFLNRSFVGFTLSQLLESYHVITLCIVLLAAVSLAFWSEAKKSESSFQN